MEIRPATQKEFETAIEWATSEGWNPGLEDLEAFFAADPNGFLMGFEEGEPISSISVVRYGGDYGFLGFYIVRPDKRGGGAGLAIWKAGLKYLKGRTVGLDGVVEQQANYEKSGFVNKGRNIRFSGAISADLNERADIRQISLADMPKLIKWDKVLFAAGRENFLKSWLLAAPKTRLSMAYWDDNDLLGYGTIRKCIEGYKIGPLFANNADIADSLFQALVARAKPMSVILDVPESNDLAVKLAQRYNLEPIFETARMYLGQPANTDIERIFGITTFELG